MTLPSIQPHKPTSIEGALQTLDAMVRAERAFDSESVERIEGFFRALKDEHASADLIEGLLNIQLLWFQQEFHKRAVPAGLKAVRWARQLGDRSLLAKALTFRAALAGENQDLSTSFEALVEALQIGKDTGDAFRVATCYSNLGAVMRYLGRDQAALRCIEAGLEWCDESSPDHAKVRAIAMTYMSDIYLRRGDSRMGLNAARTAQQFFAKVNSLMSICACAISNEVQAHLLLDDLDGAVEAIDRLQKLAEQYPSTATTNLLRQSMALHDAFAGKTEQAIQALQQLRLSPSVRDSTLRFLIDIYERTGAPEKALEVTRELLEALHSAKREVTAADLARIDVCVLDDDDSDIRELITRSVRFESEAAKVDGRLHAKLAYLFELAVSAELREENEAFEGEHIYRVGRLCATLAVEAGCDEETCWMAEVAGRLHDVGKMSLPALTILKTDPLSDAEIGILRTHADYGAAILEQLAEPRLVQVVAAVRHHHETWEGTGYPTQLSGEQIPLLARIVAICDSFDAMTHSRPFRPARSVAGGLTEIERCAGTQFEPRLAGLFVRLVRRLQREHGELDEYLGEPARRTRWAKSHPELLRLLQVKRGNYQHQL